MREARRREEKKQGGKGGRDLCVRVRVRVPQPSIALVDRVVVIRPEEPGSAASSWPLCFLGQTKPAKGERGREREAGQGTTGQQSIGASPAKGLVWISTKRLPRRA